MNKTLQKAVMTRSRLRNKFWKIKLSLTKLHIKRKGITVSAIFSKEKVYLKIYTLKTIIKNFGKL